MIARHLPSQPEAGGVFMIPKKAGGNTDSCWAPKKARFLFKKDDTPPKKGHIHAKRPAQVQTYGCKKRHFGPLPGDSAVTELYPQSKVGGHQKPLSSGHVFTHHPKKVTNSQNCQVHPGRLTWTIVMKVWKIIFLSKWVICRFHVNLPGCTNASLFFQPTTFNNCKVFLPINHPPGFARHAFWPLSLGPLQRGGEFWEVNHRILTANTQVLKNPTTDMSWERMLPGSPDRPLQQAFQNS